MISSSSVSGFKVAVKDDFRRVSDRLLEAEINFLKVTVDYIRIMASNYDFIEWMGAAFVKSLSTCSIWGSESNPFMSRNAGHSKSGSYSRLRVKFMSCT